MSLAYCLSVKAVLYWIWISFGLLSRSTNGYVIPTLPSIHRINCIPRCPHPLKRGRHPLHNNLDGLAEKHDVEKRPPYHLGLAPSLKKTHASTIKNVDDHHPYHLGLTPSSERKEKSLKADRGALSVDSIGIESQRDAAINSTSILEEETSLEVTVDDSLTNTTSAFTQIDLINNVTKEEKSGSIDKSKGKELKKIEPTKNNNLFAQTISDSFHFFEDKQNLPKYVAPKKAAKTGGINNKQNDVLSQTITDSVQFLEDNKILPKSSAKKRKASTKRNGDGNEQNDLLAETILKSFSFFDFEDAKENRLRANKKVPPTLPPFIGNITENKQIMDPSTPLTLADLQQVLQQNGYIRRDEVGTILSEPKQPKNATAAELRKTAFPQPSVVSNKHLKIGTMISSGFYCLLLAATLRPNLWLIGAVFGSLYGGDLATKASNAESAPVPLVANNEVIYYPPTGTAKMPGGLYGELSLKSGKKIASAYLYVWDVWQGFYFMYRTGQLSYEYYKTYEGFDKKFGIQNKMDAWNARFIEGKENFDTWEKDNEVGRRVLAGLRTAWLVEEKSYKNQVYLKKGRNKYRVVRIGYEIIGWYKRLFRAFWGVIRGRSSKEIKELCKGIAVAAKELSLEVVSQRLGASIAALVGINLVGALFAVAPYLLGLVAILSGIIWPNWMANGTQMIQDAIAETRARGGGKAVTRERKQKNKKEKLQFVKRSTFSSYIGSDGKKKYYRTGQSFKTGRADDDDGRSKNFFERLAL